MNRETLNKFALNQISDELKIKEILEWIGACEENKREFIRLKNLWAISDFRNFDLKSDFQKDIKVIQQNRGLSVLSALKYAAILIVGLMGGILYWFFNSDEVNYVDSSYATVIAPQGSVAKALLPDGTEIILNSGTEIRYNAQNFLNKRELSLEGEVWFSVISNSEKPFVVHTNYYDIMVLGTQFNVRAYKQDQKVVTTLEEGKVLINAFSGGLTTKDVFLKPGEQLIYDRENQQVNIKKVNAAAYSSWTQNTIEFKSTQFKELIELLEVRYGVEIELADAELRKESFTGTFKDETIEEVLEVIKLTQPIDYTIKGNKIVIRKL